DVVPAPCVQRAAVVTELVEDLLHLERGEDRLDQDGAANRPGWHPECLLGEREGLRPEARLEVALELRQVEVRTAAAIKQLRRVVVDDEAEIEEACRDRLAVDLDVPLAQMPPARTDDERCDVVVQAVGLLGRLE